MDPSGLGLLAVLAASLLGSLHCVGMCGGFVAAVGNAGPNQHRRSVGPLLAYQGARGLAYVTLGALAGLLGAGLDHGAALLGLQRFAAVAMGLVLIAMGLAALRPGGGRSREPASPLISLDGHPARRRPSLLARLRLRLTRAVRERGASAGAAAGLLSALLPCGWLWAYVVVAAATGSAGSGALVMAVFWLGSVPALLGVGLLAGELGRRLGRHAPKLTAAAMLTLGLLSLAGKLSPTPPADPVVAEAPDEDRPETEAASPALPTDAPCH